MSIEAMKQALEALSGVADWVNTRTREHPWDQWQRVEPAITTLRTAIEQAEKQEPSGWVNHANIASAVAERERGGSGDTHTWSESKTAYHTVPFYTTPPAAPEGMEDFLTDLERSRTKYPKNGRMFDGLMGEVDELRRAYAGDGDVRAEAFDVAVCAFRIATEGDAGGNALLDTPPAAPVQEPMTDEQIKQAKPVCADFVSFRAGVRYAEARYKEKQP